jgi:hydroxyacylglutathione hydrolase
VLFQRIESTGLAHYSYLVGDGGEALIIDPRRDVDVYEKVLREAGCSLKYVLETHRNEDYVVGSLELAALTDAEVWHADSEFDYGYGRSVEDGQEWGVGGLRLRALRTPGHTPGHMSYLLHDQEGSPWMVFSGDTLFAGGVGRTDLLGEERVEELTRQLYESLSGRLLALGDGVILCPAHGHGSACGGSAIADRPWTTIGFERRHNPVLQLAEDEFVEQNALMLDRPPYFDEMERLNLVGPPVLARLPLPDALAPAEFETVAGASQVLDVREVPAFGGAHVPSSLSIYEEGVASFAGWFVSHERPLLLIPAGQDPAPLVRNLVRMGYDDLRGYLAGGLHAWYTAGLATGQVECVTVGRARRRWDADREGWILDVREPEELDTDGNIPGAVNVPIKQVLDRLDEIPRGQLITVFCGSGQRSMIVASLLRTRGLERLSVVLGGVTGWRESGAPVER